MHAIIGPNDEQGKEPKLRNESVTMTHPRRVS